MNARAKGFLEKHRPLTTWAGLHHNQQQLPSEDDQYPNHMKPEMFLLKQLLARLHYCSYSMIQSVQEKAESFRESVPVTHF